MPYRRIMITSHFTDDDDDDDDTKRSLYGNIGNFSRTIFSINTHTHTQLMKCRERTINYCFFFCDRMVNEAAKMSCSLRRFQNPSVFFSCAQRQPATKSSNETTTTSTTQQQHTHTHTKQNSGAKI